MRASQSSDVSIMVRPTSLMTPAPATYVLSQTRALCSTLRRTRASLYIEEKRAWCELFDASRPMSLTELQPRLSYRPPCARFAEREWPHGWKGAGPRVAGTHLAQRERRTVAGVGCEADAVGCATHHRGAVDILSAQARRPHFLRYAGGRQPGQTRR